MWMNSPAICRAKPPTHITSKIITKISIILILFHLLFLRISHFFIYTKTELFYFLSVLDFLGG